jgi:hypothetical protein
MLTEIQDNTTVTAPEPALDLLWGAGEIARFIGKPPRATEHMLRQGRLPSARKRGREWTVTREEIRRDLGVGTEA